MKKFTVQNYGHGPQNFYLIKNVQNDLKNLVHQDSSSSQNDSAIVGQGKKKQPEYIINSNDIDEEEFNFLNSFMVPTSTKLTTQEDDKAATNAAMEQFEKQKANIISQYSDLFKERNNMISELRDIKHALKRENYLMGGDWIDEDETGEKTKRYEEKIMEYEDEF